jgi:hypothetical protein
MGEFKKGRQEIEAELREAASGEHATEEQTKETA